MNFCFSFWNRPFYSCLLSSGSEAGGDLALIQTSLLFSCKCEPLTSEQLDLQNKSSEVCIKTRSPLASLPFKGLVSEQTTVKWSIDRCLQPRIALKSTDYREVFSEIEISNFLIDVILGVDKDIKFPYLNLVRALVITCACSAIHLGPMPRFVFKFTRISVDGENIENDRKTIVWTENSLSVFKFFQISADGALVKHSCR